MKRLGSGCKLGPGSGFRIRIQDPYIESWTTSACNRRTGALCARLSGDAAKVQGATGARVGSILQGISGLFFYLTVLSSVVDQE